MRTLFAMLAMFIMGVHLLAQASPEMGHNDTSAAAQPAAPAPSSFLHRFTRAYAEDWRDPDPNAPTPPSAGYPPPVSSPPYPFAYWPYGGSPTIGAPIQSPYPFTQALQTGSNGDFWKKSGIQIYGWIEPGMNLSTSNKSHFANAPAAYYITPNTPTMDQAALYIERFPDEVQRDHFDWGFRFTNLYGTDYRFTTSKGIFSNQLLGQQTNCLRGTGKCGPGYTYGYDPVMFYTDLWFPHVAQGMNLRIGRYISLPDIEAQLAPNNYTFSHSLLYTFDCYTQVGANATIKLSDHWLVQAGVSPGCDVAPWNKIDRKLTLNTCVGYTWHGGSDNVYTCANSINDGKYAYNNLQAYYLTWYHKINAKWHTATEAWYQYEKAVPNVNPSALGGVTVPAPAPEANANGAWCRPTQPTCFAPEYAIVNYINRSFGKKSHDALIIRNEFLNDLKAQRSGTKGRYMENAVAWNHWLGGTVTFRPEIRYERNFDYPAYDAPQWGAVLAPGMKKSQLIFASDVVWHF